MTAFHELSRFERAKIYCAHGMKNMVAGNTAEARQLLMRAIRVAPAYPVSWGLFGLTAFGGRIFKFIILLRRRMVRLTNRIKG